MDEATQALQDFARRMGAGDGVVEVRVGGAEPVAVEARAFAEALRSYHDPRANGDCDHCGGALDENLVCRACGEPNGVFGQLLKERMRAGNTGTEWLP
jgi:hypothetical protein